ncbi:putative transporter protein SLAC1/Mae1/ Ssu1/TehA [Helianthus annuus]|nr:putative transporter protein SLAC1/Mae1/ Ssu1/TehA [Helianthus annuus]KAJ0472062.1 putative transporter protein SLAC1/Mae1/ Ssu1/TehA [Helianthus annuus]KAJ0651532.1 putative transporter protein SLAC1/Mae1/ Ssu1/TehA [Helianthus annuus]
MLFKKSVKEFSVAWWAFSFPLTFLALASTAYAQQVKSVTAIALAAVLSAISVLVFLFLLVFSTIKIDVLLNNPILKFSSDSV